MSYSLLTASPPLANESLTSSSRITRPLDIFGLLLFPHFAHALAQVHAHGEGADDGIDEGCYDEVCRREIPVRIAGLPLGLDPNYRYLYCWVNSIYYGTG